MIESFYLQSIDNLFFAVKGLVHPPRTVIAYLRYAPDPAGDRGRGQLCYRRLYQFDEQEAFLRHRYPAYLFLDDVTRERLQGVPHERIKRVYHPCLKLADLQSWEDADELEQRAVEFADLLAARARVPVASVGVSGSILVDLHTPRSDLDMVVYGSQQCRSVHRAMNELLQEPRSGLRRLDEEEMWALYGGRSKDTPLEFVDFARLEGRKVIEGRFHGHEYFVRFVRAPSELEESYGDIKYVPLGQAEIEATVADASEAIFTPCAYRITDVRPVMAEPVGQQAVVRQIEQIVSFRGRFCEQAREHERIVAKGKLERVVTRGETTGYRLLLGARGDFMAVQLD